jgi:heterodisulfide reductase subunit A-like polyferredoxin
MASEYSALIIGGGISGLQASLDLANHGFQVHLVEKQSSLGGIVRQLSKLFPTLQDADGIVKPMIDKVASNSNIKTYTQTEVKRLQGSIGDFRVTVGPVLRSGASSLKEEITADVIIVATGFQQYDAGKVGQYKYGKYKNVITGLEYEAMCRSDGPTGGKIVRVDNGASPASVVYVLCVGSRNQKHLSYCCNIGCLNALKHAYLLREQYAGKDVDAYICYTDIRAVTKRGEQFYQKVRASEIEFIHGQPSEIREAKDGSLTIDVYDQSTSKLLSITADLFVLETGLSPQVNIKQELGLTLDEDGFFLERNAQIETNETARDGVFLAGTVSQPMHSFEATVHASAAALKAISAARAHKS